MNFKLALNFHSSYLSFECWDFQCLSPCPAVFVYFLGAYPYFLIIKNVSLVFCPVE